METMEADNDTLILGGDFGQTGESIGEGEDGNPSPVQLDDGGDANDDADSDSDHDEAGALNGEGEQELTAGDGATGDAGSSEALFASLSKDQAKATLGRKEYKKWKQWKKAQKDSKGKKSKKDKEKHKDKDKEKDKKKEAKESKSKKSKGEESKSSRSKRQRHESDAEGFAEGDAELAEAAALGVADEFAEQLRRGPRRQLGAGPSIAIKKMRELEQLKKEAETIVERMKAARLQDQRQVPPLARLMLRPDVLKQCQRPVLHEALVAAGFLEEIRHWLCDREKGSLAPLDLRNTALDLLLGFDLEGVSSTRKKIRAALAAKRKSDDTADTYEGITATQLQESSIGESLNFVRTHPNESLDNKSKATTLLERMCRTFHGEDEEEETSGGAKWPFMGVKDIASPFEVLKTETEKFQAACVKVDKEDPLSWYRQPPKRYPRTFISGMYDGGRRGRRGSDDD